MSRVNERVSEPRSCRNKALDLLARRPHFRRELQHKLLQRSFFEDEIEDVLERLEAERLIDDHAAARGFVAARLRREAVGRRRLLADLERRGAPPGVARAVLDELYPEDDRELARAAAARWRRRARDPAARTALARHLERRGFSRRAIVAALED